MLWSVSFYTDSVIQNRNQLQTNQRYELIKNPGQRAFLQHTNDNCQIISRYVYNYSTFLHDYVNDSLNLEVIRSYTFHQGGRHEEYLST